MGSGDVFQKCVLGGSELEIEAFLEVPRKLSPQIAARPRPEQLLFHIKPHQHRHKKAVHWRLRPGHILYAILISTFYQIMPSPTALKEALRAAVRAAAAADELDQLSVNKVRSVVEKNLTLEAGFFLKPEWKDQSKQIVKDEAVSFLRVLKPGDGRSTLLMVAG